MHRTGPIMAEVQRGPSRREFWYSAFLAAMHRLPTDDALAEADKALIACNERWKQPHVVRNFRYRDDYQVGASVGLTPEDDLLNPTVRIGPNEV